jgi:lipoprotein-releasing system permease protein
MYKLLLCWRYLLTRYLALACIISVMLGVATLIVVNSVMSGFSTKLKQRLHGLLSDVEVECFQQDGFADPVEKMERIRRSRVGDKIAAMTATIETLGMIQITYNGMTMGPKPIKLIAVNPAERARLGGFAEHLTDPSKRENPSFEPGPDAQKWHDLNYPPPVAPPLPRFQPALKPTDPPPPFSDFPESAPLKLAGIIPGYSIGNLRNRDVKADTVQKDFSVLHPGDEVVIYTLSGESTKPTPVYGNVMVVDFFKSEMSEYDSQYVFVPLEWLQRMRSMEDRATNIHIMLKDYGDASVVIGALREMFPKEVGYQVQTWEEMQGPLLAAIGIEKGILNVLLFLIICVAGFGILAIFAMIVVEKTRDIGILKALGASNGGVMRIFLGYGLLLGVVGAALGTVLGLSFTRHINEIEQFLGQVMGKEIFPRDVYYFDKIPTSVQYWSVALVNLGAVAIAVMFSVLPALRAALLHPVRALRYE